MNLVISRSEKIRLFLSLPENWALFDKRLATKIAMLSDDPYEIAHNLYVEGMREDGYIEAVLRARFNREFLVSCHLGAIIEL